MIGRILSLTYNELLKQFKKISITVIIAFIIFLGILLPVIAQKLSVNNKDINDRNIVGIKNAEIKIDSFKNVTTNVEKLQLEFALIDKEYWQFMKDNNIGYKDWRNDVLEGYELNAYRIAILNKILNNVNKKSLVDAKFFEVSSEEIQEYITLSKEELNKKLNELVKINEDKKNIVKNNDYMKYLSDLIKHQEDILALQKEQIERTQEKLKVKADDESLKINLESLKNNSISTEKILSIYKYRYNNKIDFKENNWKNKTLKDIEQCEMDLGIHFVSEEQFNKGGAPGIQSDRMNYEEYKEIYNKNKIDLQEKIDRDWYSLNNNIPQLEFITDARTLVNSTYNIFVILTILLLIIIGGGVVASEFSKGTIRLLIIRPVARWKILLSKLLSLFIIAYGTIIVSVIISMITSGFILGLNSLQTAVVKTIGGKIVEVPYVQYILTEILMSSASVLFIISVVFMISTLAKSTALAVSISTILYLIAMPLTLILGFSNEKWIVNTIIPYINQSMINIMHGFIEMLQRENGIVLNNNLGSIQLVIVSIIMLIITFLIFQRKDIKN
ncbi:ABC transporter permease subunit [Clostridium tarantellae]|uniref:ABC transporter permease subunit n=1 Tax=Clostridium tarantellae TaxID=39493 RepID=A0A6I1MTP6_9CLOT|nr:ABC transporter permease subunit [Clostridium tarantellae]MPQ43609.1 ABC transporter permease subunit [Clostridium tarantellae]